MLFERGGIVRRVVPRCIHNQPSVLDLDNVQPDSSQGSGRGVTYHYDKDLLPAPENPDPVLE